MVISPLFCDNAVANATNCFATGSRATIYNKMRDKFVMKVGAGLTLFGISFDSLDSIVGKLNDYSFLI